MNIKVDDDSRLDEVVAGPLLEVPDHFTARVMAALPARHQRADPHPKASRAWRAIQAIVLALCGALGAAEVLLFICGLWTATAVGMA